jgi:hypothetical protein
MEMQSLFQFGRVVNSVEIVDFEWLDFSLLVDRQEQGWLFQQALVLVQCFTGQAQSWREMLEPDNGAHHVVPAVKLPHSTHPACQKRGIHALRDSFQCGPALRFVVPVAVFAVTTKEPLDEVGSLVISERVIPDFTEEPLMFRKLLYLLITEVPADGDQVIDITEQLVTRV